MMRRVILLDVPPDDFVLATRAVQWLLGRVENDGILSYGDGKDFYVKRNKASITVRPVK